MENYQNYNHSRKCNNCPGAVAHARCNEVHTYNEIIVEAKYICPRCGMMFHREEVSRRPKEKK